MNRPPAPASGAERSRPLGLLQMRGRDTDEGHRTATNLELLFDLTFVVAFGAAADELTHAIEAGHPASGVVGFCLAMFAILWAWINFTWFASAFDVDDWVYRLVTMVQMLGVLVLALGIPALFASLEHGDKLDNRVVLVGYAVMRAAMMAQWLRAARQAPAYRSGCLSYAVAIAVAEVGWIGLLFLPLSPVAYLVAFVVLIGVECLGPVLAERRQPTPWHAHHIAERYGLLAIIALGEGIIGTVAALSAAIEADDGWTWSVAAVGLGGVGLTFGLWWLYFTLPSGDVLHALRNSRAFPWGYGHMVVFAAIAAVGAGLHVCAGQLKHATTADHELSSTGAVLSVAIPVAVFIVAQYAVRVILLWRAERLYLLTVTTMLAVVALAVLLSAAGVSTPVCLLVLAIAPVPGIIGYEGVGRHHEAHAVARLSAQH